MKSNNTLRVACLVREIESTEIQKSILKKGLSIGYSAFLTISYI